MLGNLIGLLLLLKAIKSIWTISNWIQNTKDKIKTRIKILNNFEFLVTWLKWRWFLVTKFLLKRVKLALTIELMTDVVVNITPCITPLFYWFLYMVFNRVIKNKFKLKITYKINETLVKAFGRSKMTLHTWGLRILPQETCKDYLISKEL